MRPSRREATLAFAMLAALAGSGFAPARDTDTHVSLVPFPSTIACSLHAAVDVVVDPVADLRGFSMAIAFDPSLVAIDSVTVGSHVTGASCGSYFFHVFHTPGEDSVAIDGATLGCSMTGPGTLATIHFRGLSLPGSTAVTFQKLLLRDGTNDSLGATGDPGWIDVSCTIPVVPTTWARTKASYRDGGSP